MSKRYLFYLGHPAHFHNISKVANRLYNHGNQILFVIRDKDVLGKLVDTFPCKKIFLKEKKKDNSKWSLVFNVLKRELFMLGVCLEYRPHLMIGTDIVFVHVGNLLRIPTIMLNEDDADQVPFLARFGFNYADVTLSPMSCNNKPYDNTTIQYDGYHELAYLHPRYFKPDRSKISILFNGCNRYFIIRFAKLSAHHDKGKKGMNKDLAKLVIKALLPSGKVYITSEKEIDPEFEPYRIHIDPKDMHHALYYADIYIGDSQTMTAEAAILGTPALRFNDFVGKLGYLEELENKYQLAFGIETYQPEKLIRLIHNLLECSELKKEWATRRDIMIANTIDVGSYWLWFFENYPISVQIIKENSDYQYNFR